MEKKNRRQTAQQKLNNFLRSKEAKQFPLDPHRRLVLHAIASYVYYQASCNPSIKSLLEYTGFKDKRTLWEILGDLEALGLIKIEKKNGCRSVYFWCVPEINEDEIYRAKPVYKRCKIKKPVTSDATGNRVHQMSLVTQNQ